MFKNSSFRFVTGQCSSAYDDLKSLNPGVSNESNGFAANKLFFAIPISGSGGRIGIWKTSDTGRLPSRIPCIISGADVIDFDFDPFDDYKLCVACDDGKIRFFTIPSEGLADETTPQMIIGAYSMRVTLVKYHHLAKSTLVSAGTENGTSMVKIWDASSGNILREIPQPDMVLSLAIAFDGHRFVTATKNKTVQIFDMRSGTQLQYGSSHQGIKAARLCWIEKGDKIVSVGFGRGSQRELLVFSAKDLSCDPHSTVIDTSPSIFIPHFDEDTGVLVLTGRGENLFVFYDMYFEDKPTFLTRYVSAGSPHVSVSFLPKICCDVKKVEILRGYRLTSSSIENLSFTVPRVNTDYFQDDIFVPTRDTSSAVWLSSKDWLKNENEHPVHRVELVPENMTRLSEMPSKPRLSKASHSVGPEVSEEERLRSTMKAMFELASQTSGKNPQDRLEGVAEDEWDD